MARTLSPATAVLDGATIAGLCGLGAALPARAEMVVPDEFGNTLSSKIPTAPDLAPFGRGTYPLATIGRQSYHHLQRRQTAGPVAGRHRPGQRKLHIRDCIQLR